MEPRKQAIMQALDKFVTQRPGLEFGNYGDVKAYRSEMRSITRDRHDYNALARAVERSDSITADMLIKASESAYSGRMTIHDDSDHNTLVYRIGYVTGQYFPTEYRRAACAVLAAALWEHVRANCMPEPTGTLDATIAHGDGHPAYVFNGRPHSAGGWLRAYFRREFGASIANRWFS
jgi:hypothetical protein